MKLERIEKISIKFILSALFTLTVISCSNNVEPIDSNISVDIYNKEFEIGILSPTGWIPVQYQNTLEKVVYSWDDKISKNGNFSAAIEIKNDHEPIDLSYFWYTNVINFKVGSTYKLSCWLKTRDLNKSAVLFSIFMDGNNNQIGFSSTEGTYDVSGTSDWTFVEETFTVPEGASTIFAGGGITSKDNIGGKVWLDSFSISEFNEPQ